MPGKVEQKTVASGGGRRKPLVSGGGRQNKGQEVGDKFSRRTKRVLSKKKHL